METASTIKKIAFVGNYLPRKCGIATFTSDLLTAVTARYPQTQCFAVPVNDVEEGYEYPSVVRFEIEEQDVSSYQRAADFINISNVDLVSRTTRVRDFRRAGRKSLAGAASRTENARGHNAPYRPA